MIKAYINNSYEKKYDIYKFDHFKYGCRDYTIVILKYLYNLDVVCDYDIFA